MMNDTNYIEKNIKAIADYFRHGCKPGNTHKIGVETEFFVIDKQGNPITYAELEKVMKTQVKDKDTVVEEDGYFLGYYNKDFSVTLEPSAQLEISVMPQSSLARMEKILSEFNRMYGNALADIGYTMVNAGYHPTRKAEELSLIPKKRYEYMNDYFKGTGDRGYQMMRATASTQVAVDYSDEEDFVKKYRLACALVPVFSLLTENSPVYEKQPSQRFLTRSYVWQDVDSERCLIPDCTYSQDFGFDAYAEEIYGKPPILIKEGSTTIYTKNKTIREIYCDRQLAGAEIEHLLSMFFPDIRLKQYLEIRPGDSLPLELTLAYVALVREIFYNKTILENLSAYLKVSSKQEIEVAKNNLMEHGYEGTVYGIPVANVVDKIFALIENNGEYENKKYLKPLARLARKRIVPKQDKNMSKIKELVQEYRSIVEQDLAGHGSSAKEISNYIQNSTAKYHGRCVRTLYIPKLFTLNEVELFDGLIKTLYGIFYKVMDKYQKDAEYRKLFGFDERLEKLILRKPAYDCPLPIARIDIFLDEENGDFKFCEFNTDGSSAMNEDRELNNAIRLTKAYQEFAGRHTLTTFELFDSWVEEFLTIYATFKYKKDKPHVAIVDFMESATNEEFKIFAKAFEKKGISVEICEIRDLKYKEGILLSPTGKGIDAIYRRAVTSDIMKHFDEIQPFIQAVVDEKVCLIGDFRTQIVHNKVLYKILHDERTKAFLTEEENAYVKAHVPFTVSLEDGKFDYDEVISYKNNWIIKPEDSYGSKGVHAGVECNDVEWKVFVDECINQGYILQEFCMPYESENIDLVKDTDAPFRPYCNLTGLFVYNGKFKGCYSRISQSEIISTQYSEMALPTIVVCEKE